MRTLHDVNAVAMYVQYLALSIAMLASFAYIYMLATPYHDIDNIKQGKVCSALAMGGAILGFTATLVVASYYGATVLDFIEMAATSCAVQVIALIILRKLLPGAVEDNNVAGATLYACAAVAVGLLNAASFIP